VGWLVRLMCCLLRHVPKPPPAPACLPACLQGRAKRGELHYLPSAQAYFDDVAHFREMTSLCSYTHPRVWQDLMYVTL
jgi:hypothetical protein